MVTEKQNHQRMAIIHLQDHIHVVVSKYVTNVFCKGLAYFGAKGERSRKEHSPSKISSAIALPVAGAFKIPQHV